MEKIIGVKRMIGTDSQVVIGDVESALERFLPRGRVVVIADANVHRCHGALVDRFEHVIIGQGESNKTLQTLENIYRSFLGLGIDRSTFILGIGGGIVTDLTGFAASTYMRGLHFGFIATTLLAQVDASIGGKNGVNIDGYKNIVGVFNQPDFVVCDPKMLKTLPEREFKAGLAEIIKAGIIADAELFDLFESHTLAQFQSDPDLLGEAILRAINVKAHIVDIDEHESGERRKLNLGHTIAHAIEKCSRQYLHGEAVAIGTVAISRGAVNHNLLSAEDGERVVAVFERYGLPTESPIDMKQLLKAVRVDKKCESGSINVVVPTAIGNCIIERVTFSELESKIF